MALRTDGSRRNGEEGVEARRQGRRVGGDAKKRCKKREQAFLCVLVGVGGGGGNPRGNEEKEGVRG